MNAVTETKAAHSGIAAALSAAQAEMGSAPKSANNPHFKSKYADLDSVMDACRPALNRHGIAVIQPPIDDESGRYVETRLLHSSGESLSCRVPLIVQKNDMQGYGSAVTYARRYGLMCMAGIAPDDDDGNAAVAAAPRQKSKPEPKPANDAAQKATEYLSDAETLDDLAERWKSLPNSTRALPAVQKAKDAQKAALQQPENADLDYDNVPF